MIQMNFYRNELIFVLAGPWNLNTIFFSDPRQYTQSHPPLTSIITDARAIPQALKSSVTLNLNLNPAQLCSAGAAKKFTVHCAVETFANFVTGNTMECLKKHPQTPTLVSCSCSWD